MKTTIEGVRIAGILGVLPEHRVSFDDEVDNYAFPAAKTRQMKGVLGLDERRLVPDGVCTSDLCAFGVEHLVARGDIDRSQVDAMVLVTQTPDHFLPPTSAILQGRLGLPSDAFCMDVNQGCAGYIHGLLLGFSLLQLPGCERVLLLAGDTLSRAASPHDRNIYPLIGDAASVTLLERAPEQSQITVDLRMDGSRSDWLQIPAGAYRMPNSEATRVEKDGGDGNRRSLEQFHMNGSGIFLFSQTDVPEMINDLITASGYTKDEVDYCLFHQPNRFILGKLARHLGIPDSKVPDNVVELYGNSSSATIPIAACENLADEFQSGSHRVLMAGFGVGLTWGGMVMELGPLDFCELIDMPDEVARTMAASEAPAEDA
jgi:3-oxoacyl-[acyl-carrier-protein] synthase-3